MKRFITTLLIIASTPLLGYDERLSMDQIMSPEEAKNIGIERMSLTQRQALEAWAANWTHHVIEQAPSYRPGENLSAWVQTWPPYANPTKNELNPDEMAQRQKSNQVIDKNRNNGEIIDLKDGSSWTISPFYRYVTTQWLRGQVITVSQGSNVRHPWVLNNLTSGQTAEADMTNPPSPNGQKPPENSAQYKGSTKLQAVTTAGDNVNLADGSSWRIAPTDMYKSKNWSPADRIKVDKSDSMLYPYRLSNLDTGETALATQK